MRKSIFGCHRGLIDLGMWVSKLFSVLVFPMLSYLRHSHSQSMFDPAANQRSIRKPISDRSASQSAIESKRPIRARLGANFVGGRVFWECAVVFPLTSFLVSGHSVKLSYDREILRQFFPFTPHFLQKHTSPLAHIRTIQLWHAD